VAVRSHERLAVAARPDDVPLDPVEQTVRHHDLGRLELGPAEEERGRARRADPRSP
jgi:hypothetical protein